jgi:amino acid adenylation domain-containing protein
MNGSQTFTFDTQASGIGIGNKINGLPFNKNEVEGSIPQRFEKVVSVFPERVALHSWDGTFTYNEFNSLANILARQILARKGPLNKPVGFFVSAGYRQILAIFGILKANGAYVPLDPNFPLDRLAYMLEDSDAEILITDDALYESAKGLLPKGVQIINLDQIDSTTSELNLGLVILPDDLISIQYTSGSTGKPKGVIQNHRNILHAAWVIVHVNETVPDDRVALLHSTGFSASALPIFGTLLMGATLYPFDLRNNMANLVSWIREEQITIFQGVPTLYRHFAMSLTGGEQFPHLRLITAGGESVLKVDVDLYKKHFSQTAKFRHGLGSTETQTMRQFIIDQNTVIDGNIVPVGYAVEDKEILIIGEDGHYCLPNEEGEIVIRSRYISPGYWKKPELTAQRFKPDPIEDGVTLFYTGDLGRIDEEGCLYHLGRKDFQVKIRGFRVELGEIEAVLMQHSALQQAVVLVHERPGFEKRLVAYILPDKKQLAPTEEELRLFIRKRLPDYMLPSVYVYLDSLPVTPTGKVNRLGLPKLEEVYHLETDYVAPCDDTEKRLVAVWEDLFQLHPIGVCNDFFSLGGHSLLAATLITKIEENFGKRLEIAVLSAAPTIRDLAKHLKAPSTSLPYSPVVCIKEGTCRPLFCVHGVGGHIYPFIYLADHLDPDQPLYSFQCRQLGDDELVTYTLESIATNYIEAICRIQPEGPYQLGGFSFGGFVAYEMARQLSQQGKTIALLAIFDTQARVAPGYFKALHGSDVLQYKTKALYQKITFHAGKISKLPPREMVTYIRQRIDRHDKQNIREVMMGDVEDEQVPDYMMGIIQANIQAMQGYVPKTYPGKVTLFRSIDHGKGVYYGWSELAKGGVEIFDVPGDHRGILQEPNVHVLASQLNLCLQKASFN